jgi:hypothetical protein
MFRRRFWVKFPLFFFASEDQQRNAGKGLGVYYASSQVFIAVNLNIQFLTFLAHLMPILSNEAPPRSGF